jgi:hypothetical protein
VDRVPGHPVGRVTRQRPLPGTASSPGGVVRVSVTAGGDRPGDAPPPVPYTLGHVEVPDLLDRTGPQAARILEDVGLVAAIDERRAASGPPDRVADQRPAAGTVAAKGTTVHLTLGPPASAPPSAGPPTVAPPVSSPSAPGSSPSALRAPEPIAPAEGTAVPGDRLLPLGFAWRAVDGADAYLVEVEERGPEGWLPTLRKPSRTSALTAEVERLCPRPGDLRWRVSALRSGRAGPASVWVNLPTR